jgi:hypothetical protein
MHVIGAGIGLDRDDVILDEGADAAAVILALGAEGEIPR